MDRRLIAGALGLFLIGCAQTRTPLPEGTAKPPPVEMGGYTPIKESINRTADPSARRASMPAPAPADGGPPPMIPAEAPPIPAGRPAPYAGQTEGTPRPRAATADAPTFERPAPNAGQAQDGPRPQAEKPYATELPSANPVVPTPAPVVPTPAPDGPLPGLDAPDATRLPSANPIVPRPAPASAPTVEGPKVDPAVAQTSAPASPEATSKPLPGSSGTAATVGDEVITLTQLRAALKEQLDRIPPEQRGDPSMQRQLVDKVLGQLIERTLLVQAAKKQMKDPKAINHFYEAVDKAWAEHEMPPMLRETKTTNIHELKAKLAERGVSLDQIRDDFRMNTLAREFMMMKLGGKLTVSLNDKQAYYTAHLDDFNRPAQVSWREIAIDTAKCASREEARKKVDGLLARVSKGEDFARVAKAESHGATAREGGLWETAPGSYAIPAVNEAIEALQPGQISRVIEAPAGFHIVLLQSKREAGPARFDEVQDEVRDLVLRQKQAKLFGGYIDNLRTKTLITTMFDGPTSDPSAVRTGGQDDGPK